MSRGMALSHRSWKGFFPADGNLAGVSCAGFRKTSAGVPLQEVITSVDQTKETHTAQGTVPRPAPFVKRGRLPIKNFVAFIERGRAA